MYWAAVHSPCTGLLFKTVKGFVVIREGQSERFNTFGSGDEHPKLVRNPGPLTCRHILTRFWENRRYLIPPYIMPYHLSPVGLQMSVTVSVFLGSGDLTSAS